MATKYVFFNQEVRDAIKAGIDRITDAIAVSLGVKGKCVILHNSIGSEITKDGYKISKAINLEHEIERIGAGFIKEAAKLVVDSCGDGTTTVSVLLREIATEGFKQVSISKGSLSLKSGIDKAVYTVVENIRSMSEQVDIKSEKLVQVATISANNNVEIGKMVADMYARIGKHGTIHIKESKGFETSTDISEGYQFDRGLISILFADDRIKETAELKNPYILVYDGKISRWEDVLHLVEKIHGQKRSLLIIADDIEGEALKNFAVNTVQRVIKTACVRSPSFGDTRREMMEDICVLTGATYISEERGYKLTDIDISHLGNCVEVQLSKSSTTIVKGSGTKESFETRKERIQNQIKESKSKAESDIHLERLSKIEGGVGVIYVGASSETEMKEKIDRVEDAVKATKCAIEEGVVVGAGTSLIRSIPILESLSVANEEERIGVNIVKKSLECILRQICKNADADESYIVRMVKESTGNMGYNAKTDNIEDLKEAGVLDPVKVVIKALENAASIASTLIISDSLVVNTD